VQLRTLNHPGDVLVDLSSAMYIHTANWTQLNSNYKTTENWSD